MSFDVLSFGFGLTCGALVTHQIWDITHRELMYQQTAKVIRLMAKPVPTDSDQ